MKFAHLADCHVGSWRDPRLREISVKAFIKAIDSCIKEEVDFIVVSGDLFNTSVPSIDSLKEAVKKLKELKDRGIPVYGVAGSHDFSASGKTMLDVIEEAGLYINVFKGKVHDNKLHLEFTIDKKTGAKITGIIGKKGMLDRRFYEQLDRKNLEEEKGYKIFLLHTAITEIKPKELERMDSAPLSYLPKGFDYYAAGHVHYVFEKRFPGLGLIAYPGSLFPTNFVELEKYGRGGFYIVSADLASKEKPETKLEWKPIQIVNTFSINIDCNRKTAKEVEQKLLEAIEKKEFINTIITIRLFGELSSGKPSDIDFRTIYGMLFDKSAYYIMKNLNALTSKEFESVEVEESGDVEAKIIEGNLGQFKIDGMTTDKEKKLIHDLIAVLSAEKEEGEKTADFEKRVLDDASKILEIK